MLKDVTESELREHGASLSVQPFHLQLTPDISARTSLKVARAYALRSRSTQIGGNDRPFKHHPQQRAGSKIKIGYVSSAFGNHPIGYLTQGIYALHDKSAFEVYCYSLSPSDDSSPWRKMQRSADHVVDVSGLSCTDAAAKIYEDGIQVLINLNGYTRGAKNEVFGLAPAPVQIAMMGHGGTMGAEYVHYIVADETTVPEDHKGHFTETVIYVPQMSVNDCQASAGFVLDEAFDSSLLRAECGISDDAFVYACFNQSYKIDPELFRAWMDVLKDADGSVLLLLRYNERVEPALKAEAEKCGVDPERLVFLDLLPREEHLRRCCIVDLALDTRICGGTAVGCEALWVGTPMISIEGDRMCNRVGASLLKSVGLGDLVVDNLRDYKRLAVEMHTNEDRFIKAIRNLEDNRLSCNLFDTEGWVRSFERALTQVVSRYENGLAPEDVYSTDDK